MKSKPFKTLLRRMVVATAFPPLLQMYRALYAFIIHRAVKLFRKYPQIKAVYLRRGCAKGELAPGISDIDLDVIVEDMNEEQQAELCSTYGRFARAMLVPDPDLGVLDAQTLTRDACRRYRFIEGKATWKLLYGRDYLADLPEPSSKELYLALHNEIKVWWTIFAWQLVQTVEHLNEPVHCNSLCFKTVCEVLKLDLALNRGILKFSRREALELAKGYLNSQDLEVVARLEACARKRFLVPDKHVVDQTLHFLFRYLDRFYDACRSHPHAASLKCLLRWPDCPPEEWLRGAQEQAHARRLVQHVREHWSPCYREAQLLPGSYRDEPVLLLPIVPGRPPATRALSALYELHRQGDADTRSRMALYLLMPFSAYQLDTVYDSSDNSVLMVAERGSARTRR